jgi:hypothetical protein
VKARSKYLIAALYILVVSTGQAQGRPLFDLTGTILDADTLQPIDGAYVLASYKAVLTDNVSARAFCMKTLGTFSGRDGRYKFPVEKLDGYSPFFINAIKPDYYLVRFDMPDPDSRAWLQQRPETYANRNIYLKKQDAAHPSFHFANHEEVCDRAKGEDLSPALRFIEMEIAEEKRLGAPANGVRGHEDLLRALQGLPPANAPADWRR